MAFAIGQKAQMTRTFDTADVAGYVALGGHEPANGEVPEPLVNALFSRLLGVELPRAVPVGRDFELAHGGFGVVIHSRLTCRSSICPLSM